MCLNIDSALNLISSTSTPFQNPKEVMAVNIPALFDILLCSYGLATLASKFFRFLT